MLMKGLNPKVFLVLLTVAQSTLAASALAATSESSSLTAKTRRVSSLTQMTVTVLEGTVPAIATASDEPMLIADPGRDNDYDRSRDYDYRRSSRTMV